LNLFCTTFLSLWMSHKIAQTMYACSICVWTEA
jgi:hypothetical protein